VADLVAKVNSGRGLKEELAAERRRYAEYRQSSVGIENENFKLKAQISARDAEMFKLYDTITSLNNTLSKKDAEVDELKKQKDDLEKRVCLILLLFKMDLSDTLYYIDQTEQEEVDGDGSTSQKESLRTSSNGESRRLSTR
jgi:chromosome segregation ATPase